jgi:hypothetical protein
VISDALADTEISMKTVCDVCGRPLEQETSTGPTSGTWTETYNHLYITIEGCYGGFIDTGDEIGIPALRYVVCHDCAVKVGAVFPALAEAHTHSTIECTCPDYPARKARFDAAIAKQKSDWDAHKDGGHSSRKSVPGCMFCARR